MGAASIRVAPRVPVASQEVVTCSGRSPSILIVLWLLGLLTSFTMNGFIHILLVLAVIAVLIRIIQGRRVV